MAEEQTFTQEQVNALKNEWIENEFNPLKTQFEELQAKLPKDKTDEEKALEQKQADLWQKEVELELKSNGLSDFAPFISAKDEEDLKGKIEQLNKIVAGLKIDSSYKPDDHKQTNEYDTFEKNKDTKGMIGTKLANLFK